MEQRHLESGVWRRKDDTVAITTQEEAEGDEDGR